MENPNKCYSCGKVFTYTKDLTRHKNRKTPCLIREVPPEQANNPNRCIFCNKIFSKKENLTRHLKTCKIKNGGMEILVDKVRYDQEIRILKEQREQDKKEIETKFDAKLEEKDEQIKKLMEEMEALKKAVAVPQPQVVNNTIYNAPVVNITLNNYNAPTTEGLTISREEIANISKLSKYLLQKLYFNPELPQNHCMYLVNKKDKSLLVYDSAWRIVTGENTGDVIKTINGTIADKGGMLINGISGPYKGSDEVFTNLNPADRQKIFNFNTFTDQLSPDDAYEVFLGGRDVVLTTIKAAGCKLI